MFNTKKEKEQNDIDEDAISNAFSLLKFLSISSIVAF
jgi:hypothetical protein